jgi:site-specific DNA-cytosine methylase
MKILELFAGTRSIGKAFEAAGHTVYSIEWDSQHEDIDWYADIGTITAADIIERFGKPDVIWASPDCTSYSIAAISHHRTREENGNLAPKSDYAKLCDKVNENVLRLIHDLDPYVLLYREPTWRNA